MPRKKQIVVPENKPAIKEVQKITINGKGFPTSSEVFEACMSYFAIYRTSSEIDKKGVIEFNQDGLNKISDVGMYNAIGITRQRWASWKSSQDMAVAKKRLRDVIEYVEQVLEQVDQERLSVRGNVGDKYRMEIKYKEWRLSKDDQRTKAIEDMEESKLSQIIQRMAR